MSIEELAKLAVENESFRKTSEYQNLCAAEKAIHEISFMIKINGLYQLGYSVSLEEEQKTALVTALNYLKYELLENLEYKSTK